MPPAWRKRPVSNRRTHGPLSHFLRLLVGNKRLEKVPAGPSCRKQRLQIRRAESHAAAIKHPVISAEKTIGRTKRYLQPTTVMAAKQTANAHAVPRMSAKASAGRTPRCHANSAAKK